MPVTCLWRSVITVSADTQSAPESLEGATLAEKVGYVEGDDVPDVYILNAGLVTRNRELTRKNWIYRKQIREMQAAQANQIRDTGQMVRTRSPKGRKRRIVVWERVG